jgi:hypothetical protein
MSTTDPEPDSTLAAETERRLGLITSRFPNRFSEAQIGEVRARIERSVNLGRSLRAAELGSGDGPDLILTALPPRAESA